MGWTVAEEISAKGARADGVEYRSSLLRFLTSRVGCRATAEDLTQEAFLRFARTETVRNPKAFLFQTAVNLVRTAARSESRRARLSDYAHLVMPDDIDMLTPERALLASDELARIRMAIESLPPVCAQVFHLHRNEGLTQREIAARLEISTTAVEKSMRRALSRLAAAANGAVEQRHSGQAAPEE
ncbi:sigma-70 family RNA polymerase sigma factor [Sphingomonas sp.]|uniref:RNA polymerase sigma factor n=1 Tax=Sphingomonas sp. TaxID=28214 RepID=UPI0025EB250E|nr:sigma-70 family RNA polymerase sigma factor [Sphingomonas sp.]